MGPVRAGYTGPGGGNYHFIEFNFSSPNIVCNKIESNNIATNIVYNINGPNIVANNIVTNIMGHKAHKGL